MVTASQVNKAISQKNNVALSVASIEGHISNHSVTALNKYSVNVYSRRLDEIYRELCGLYDTILEGCDAAEKHTHETERVEILDKVMTAQAGLLAIQEQLNPTPTHPPTGGGASGSVAGIRLPKLDLQKFSGDILEWRSFKDLYVASIHLAQMTGAQKLQYLKSFLATEPLSAIQSIPITDANYSIAWKVLCDRYDDSKLITTSYLKTLFSQPYMKEESASALRKLWDTTIECERNLKELGWPTDKWAVILVHVVSQRLDTKSREQWEIQFKGVADLTTVKMETFMKERAQALESMRLSKKPDKASTSQNIVKTQAASHVATASKCDTRCQDHFIWKCETFVSASPCERRTLVKQHNLCYNCLRPGHKVSNCRSRNCKKCGKRHNTMLHTETTSEASQRTVKQEESTRNSSSDQPALSLHAGSAPSDPSKVVLATAKILVKDSDGKFQTCRALLDPGSQATFISQACATRLRLKLSSTSLGVTGVNVGANSSKSWTTLNISSSLDSAFNASAVGYVLPQVTTLIPTAPLDPARFAIFKNLELADSNFYSPSKIDILIGADHFYELLREGFVRSHPGGPIAMNTVFGWVIAGPSTEQSADRQYGKGMWMPS